MLIYDDLWHNYDLINHYTSVVGLLITLIGKIYIGVIAVTPPPTELNCNKFLWCLLSTGTCMLREIFLNNILSTDTFRLFHGARP